jgi:hypothetical protein
MGKTFCWKREGKALPLFLFSVYFIETAMGLFKSIEIEEGCTEIETGVAREEGWGMWRMDSWAINWPKSAAR